MDRTETNISQGTTPAERYLAQLCRRTFLSLWSYPNVFREVNSRGSKIGHEVCDLLVVFENRVLIFSDKDCAVPETGDIHLDWGRWFRRAVIKNARQAHGAERHLRHSKENLFLDSQCTQRLPVTPEINESTRFHLLVVAHRIAQRCSEELGGSGSLMLNSALKGAEGHTIPFQIGDLDPSRSFVHILDESSLDVLLNEMDTLSDLATYLDRKEEFLRSSIDVMAAGEEELLWWYLKHADDDGKHCFDVPDKRADLLVFEEGAYRSDLGHPQRLAKLEANEVSYTWDELIERFAFHAMGGTQVLSSSGGLSDTEQILRWMARESRTRRRMLARQLLECVSTTPVHLTRTTVGIPSSPGDPYYVFVMFPWIHGAGMHDNRLMRHNFLEAACMVVRLKFPDAVDVVGIATESGASSSWRSEDAMYCNFRDWTPAMAAQAQEYQRELKILTSPKETRETEYEYPEPTPRLILPMNVGRNEPCPCGSGKKFKRCHGKPRSA